MSRNSDSQMLRKSTLSRRFTIITVMFLSVLLGLLAYTMMTLQKDKSNAFLIDMAGRQRMLLQKHINEVFLTSQGVAADYLATRELIHSTLNALMEGGSVMLNPKTHERQMVPPAPSKEIWEKLREQQNQVKHIYQLADQFLLLTPDHLEFRPQLQTLRTQHSLAIRTADQAVKQLDEYAKATISTMVKWEILIAIFVGLLGMFVTSKGVRDGRKLEKEVEERQRAESALRDSELFLNSIVENIPDMIFVKTAQDLRFVRLNKAGETLLDRSRNEVLGKSDHEIFPNEQADFFTTKDTEVLAGKKFVDVPHEPIQTKSKGLRHLHTKKIPLLDEQGHPQYLLGISEDITERLQAQESLRRSEERYRALYEDNPSMYFTVAQDGKILSVNGFGAQQLGYSVDELIGRPVIDLFLEDDKAKVQERFEACLRNPLTTFSWEFRKVRKDRRVLWVKEVARTIQGEDKETVVLIVCEDITERKEKDAQLKTLSHRLLLATASAKMGIWDLDITQDVLNWDEQMFDLYGLVQEGCKIGYETWAKTLHPEDRKRAETELQQAILGIKEFHTEFRIVWPDQSIHTLQAHAVVQRDDAGTAIRIIGVNWDRTEQKKTDERLRESEVKRLKALRQSDELKSALLASVSHELRTPLTAMKASISSIVGNAPSTMDEIQQEFLKGIDQEINYMSRLVDNLLDMSQIEAGTLVPQREWHPLEDLVEGALRRTEQLLETRDIQIQIPDDIPPVYVDAVEMQQVLINLLDNAVKYSPPNSPILLCIGVSAQQIEVQVSNRGGSIQAQDLERIFERFYRGRLPREEPIRGTGLGLAICKAIVEAHGGRTWAESNEREVVITFTIPMTESMANFSLEGQHKA